MTKRRNIRHKIIQRDGLVCQACGADCSEPVETGWLRGRKDGAHIDHQRPLWLTGDDSEGNQVVLCERCHKSKTKQEAALLAKLKRLAAKHEAHKRRMEERRNGAGLDSACGQARDRKEH